MTRPVRARTSASSPRLRRSSQMAAVRRHCQTTASLIARPVARSQTIVVSRWFVMPIGGDVADGGVRVGEQLAGGVELRRPDRLGIVRDPAGLRVDLRELERGLRDGCAGVVEEDGARTGRALVEREDVLRHMGSVGKGGASARDGAMSRRCRRSSDAIGLAAPAQCSVGVDASTSLSMTAGLAQHDNVAGALC